MAHSNVLKLVNQYKKHLFVRGQIQSEDEIVAIRMIVNGKYEMSSSQFFTRKDGLHEYWFFCDNFDEDIEMLEFYGDVNGQEIVIDTVKKEMIEIQNQSFVYAIDFETKSGQVTQIEGWAVSYHHSEIQYQLLENDVASDMTLRVIPYNRLRACGFDMEPELFAGFTATFVQDSNRDYQFVIKDGESLVRYAISNIDEVEVKASWQKILNHINLENIKKGVSFLKENGIKELFHKIMYGMADDPDYHIWFLRNRVTNQELLLQREHHFTYEPKISLLVPTYNTPIDLLEEMIETVLQQSYGNWELCIADGSDASHQARARIREYANSDSRIKVVELDQNYGISGNTNEALKLATGDYIALYDHDDFLELNTLYEVVNVLNKHKYDVIYTDEDKYSQSQKKFVDPNLKPDFSIDLLRSHNYITHLFVVKKEIMNQVGGFRSEYDGSQDYDVILRSIELADDSIYHLPMVLYHWRIHDGSTAQDPESKMYCYEAGQKAIQDHLARVGIDGQVTMLGKPFWGLYHVKYVVKNNPLISIIIPNYEAKDTLETCLNSLFNVNSYQNFEVIIVENNSKSDEIFAYYEEVQSVHGNVKVVTWSGKEFNYSAVNNFGEQFAKGEYLLFLNNDTEMIKPDSLEEMLGICQREEVGAVGAKLLYANDTVQHAGVIIGFGGFAGHAFSNIAKDDPGFMMRALINCDYSAVTAACLMTKKELFHVVGGFDEKLAIALNDVDFCLKIRSLKKLIVYDAFSLWHHYESVSRGYETSESKRKRFEQEIALFQNRWKKLLIDGDPYYNKNFDVKYTPYEVR